MEAEDRNLIRQYSRTSLLTLEEELEAHRTGDHTKLVQSHLRVAVFWGSYYAKATGLPCGDLIQEATLGLMRAAQTFSPDKGARFSTYSGFWARNAVHEYVSKNRHIVTIRRSAGTERCLQDLAHAGHRDSDEVVAKRHKLTAETVKALRRMVLSVIDIDKPVKRGTEDDETTYSDIMADTRPLQDETLLDEQIAKRRAEWLQNNLASLPERMRKIVEMRHLQEEPATLEEIGSIFHISEERVRQVEVEAMSRLRRAAHLAHKAPLGVAAR